MNAENKVGVYLDAAYPVLAIQSHEEDRVERALCSHIEQSDRDAESRTDIYRWATSRGLEILIGPTTISRDAVKTPQAILQYINSRLDVDATEPDSFVWILWDFCHFLTTGNAYPIARQLKDIAQKIAEKGLRHSIVIVDAVISIPDRLEKVVTVIDWPLPSREEIIEQVISEADAKDLACSPEQLWDVSNAALGLTKYEVGNVLARSVYETDGFDAGIITQEKKGIIRRSGHLEFWDATHDLSSVGGMDVLKSWLQQRRLAFSEKAREYRLALPAGILIAGVPGCGKSWIAKAIGGEWKLPVLRLDLGKIMGSYLGQSERQLREALKLAETISPACLWVDELEKGLGGSGGERDGGTSGRVLGTWLTWMQEKQSPVFVIATANNISALPPETLRAGRFDSIFFVDLPNRWEREEILRVHLNKKGRDPDNFDVPGMADGTTGFTGAEIESLISAALFAAFSEDREITSSDILNARKVVVPISKTMKEDLDYLRQWADGRAVRATSQVIREAPQVTQTTGSNRLSRLRKRKR